MFPKPTKPLWIVSSEEAKKQRSIALPNAPVHVLRQYESKNPPSSPQPPKEEEKLN